MLGTRLYSLKIFFSFLLSENLTTTEQPIQIVVSVDQVEKMISQGWRFLATLPGEKAVFENFGFRTRDV
ncbi:hypothetical protein NSIN_20411 [Nitrosotalea sinensis]|uniref:Uncharacterized protein n=1 Tax=Nitrosotalea sinensis TaxID=1499975 RepID=A0A2H1EFT5_9ARCH|nr:hypothetical protein NSIN_20411 [Candidatus Nitrosotalea sinensis]